LASVANFYLLKVKPPSSPAPASGSTVLAAMAPAPHNQSITRKGQGVAMYQYPGLGLPLRYNPQYDYDFYPHGANNYGSESELIFVRELAMMDVMDKLTDKLDWHKKVFDDGIVEQWKKEAMAIPDEQFYQLAAAGKSRCYDKEAEGIMNKTAFRYVSAFFSNVEIVFG
jgi:hypothetical protein